MENPAIKYRKKAKARLVEAFGGKCGICGYNRCHTAFEFHHTDEAEKVISLMMIIQHAWWRVVIEARKCVMLCANCHREVHAGMSSVTGDTRRFDEAYAEWGWGASPGDRTRPSPFREGVATKAAKQSQLMKRRRTEIIGRFGRSNRGRRPL